MIDYEQLKIENQTLNEKIEERNEELTRLRGKIINQVIMLSHTREKMKFIETQNAKNEKELTELNSRLDDVKTKLTIAKNERAKKDKENQKLSQKTGIARDNSLKSDFLARTQEFMRLKAENEKLVAKHAELVRIIKEARMVEQQAQYEM